MPVPDQSPLGSVVFNYALLKGEEIQKMISFNLSMKLIVFYCARYQSFHFNQKNTGYFVRMHQF